MKTYLTHRNTTDFIDEALNSFFRPFYFDAESSVMKTDISQTDTDYKLEIEMPGFDKKDISIKMEKGYLTVSAKRESPETKYIRCERDTSYSRSYYMGDVDETLITAKYTNGILEILVPKQKPEQTQHTILID